MKRTWLFLGVIVTALAVLFIASVLAKPVLPDFNLRHLAILPGSVNLKPKPLSLPTNPSEQKARKAEADLQRALAKVNRVVPAKRRSHLAIVPPPLSLPPPAIPSSRPLAIGFFINWDESSYESLKRNLDHLDWVIPEWIHLQDTDRNDTNPIVTDIHVPALNWIRENHPQVQILPMVQNLTNEKFDGSLLARAIVDEPHRQTLINSLETFVEDNKFGGISVDFEDPPDAAQPNLLTFMQELHSAFTSRHLLVTQNVPFNDEAWDYKRYAENSDYLILMAYDQHWANSDAGPIAGQSWFEQTLARRMTDLNPSQTIIALGNYGYDWTDSEAKELTFQEALITARESEAIPTFDSASRNLHFDYDEEDQSHHSVWFLDAVTAFNQMRASSGYKPAGYAVWRLGSEDPSIWNVLGPSQNNTPDALKTIEYGYVVDFQGNGELLQVTSRPQRGSRTVQVDPSTGFIEKEEITSSPSSYVVQRTGDRPGLLALTFDDGPDPRWTPAILDVLKRENVPATFFIIGKNGQAYPDLVRRIVNEGHEIGNHTYTHPNLGEMPLPITEFELNATQRLIESLVGRSTVLFRPPYFGDAEADKPQEVEPAILAQKLGYVMVGVRIDPDDWQLPVTPSQIVNRTVDRAIDNNPETRGQVILLHDAGGDRSATVAALPTLIHDLKARGYRFVAVSELAGLSKDQVMPPIPPNQRFFTRADAVTFFLLSIGGWSLQWIFVIGILLGLGRLLFVGSLAFAQWVRSRRRQQHHAGRDYSPFVSVIVPAYNEELVINNTIHSLLTSAYSNFEIIVVDDGSTDDTSKVVIQGFGDNQRVELLTVLNAGKAAALNTGLRHARGEVIVALDADTIFAPQTIGALAHRFYNPKLGAIAGNAKVGNRINLITRWQALEYITSQNMDRRAFASLNCITVVPGAVGAWRKDLLEQVGGFPADTLAEDQDLTLQIRRLGYEIGYEETAVAWTEAPDRLRPLARQRYRWAYGTLQCMWKHSDALFRRRFGTLGFIAMPNVWIFQILFPLISPIMDLMLLYSLVLAGLDWWQHAADYSSANLQQVLIYYALFLAIDWLSACFAFMLERKERWSLLWWLFLQRFCYRQVMYYVMIKSVAMALRGPVVGWGKLERKATVEAGP